MGALNYKTPDQLKQEDDEKARQAAENRQASPAISGLSSYVDLCWQAALQAKAPIERRMFMCLRAKQGQYEPERLAEIEKHGGSTIYMNITEEKCNAAESWLEDILMQPDANPWGVDPTPIPELSPDKQKEIDQDIEQHINGMVQRQIAMENQQHFEQTGQSLDLTAVDIQYKMQEAYEALKGSIEEYRSFVLKETKKQAKAADVAIERKMEDELEEASWEDALRDAIPDIVGMPAGFVKGPIFKRKKEMVWGEGPDGRSVPTVEHRIVKEFYSPSPLDMYPSPNSKDIGDGFLFEVHRMTRLDLTSLIGVPGYDEQAIRAVLTQYGSGGLKSWLWLNNDHARNALQGRQHADLDPEGKIEALQFWGNVQGKHLIMFGVPAEQIPDPLEEYAAELWKIGPYVIKAELNGDPLGRPPYYKAGVRPIKGSFWYKGVPEVLEDIQEMCNSAARALCNNMALASGPQVGVDMGAIPPGEKVTEMYPLKVWPFNMGKNPASGRQPIWFFQPKLLAGELLNVYAKWSDEADVKTGIPKYSYGASSSGGALSTAAGMSMMMTAASRGIKRIIRCIDKNIIKPSVVRLWQYLMLFEHDETVLRGDIKIKATGSSALMVKEQQAVRRNEFLQIALHPSVQNIIGPTGLANILRPTVQGLDYDTDKIIPEDDEIMKQIQEAMAQPGAIPGEGQPVPAEMGQGVDAAGAAMGGGDAALFQGGN
ncbi:hypothetical protein SYK_02820 [Pseudodesulfovibrio nedwellii]|uniref:Portal protein n=1 Tax=Pseudodesulfovibrio nedwellii TaxID=2973072 RepID=A0ABM8AWR2_9BACT|nr:hypothetical protein [Pseudodesulfovibrio nedwellii]BDQ35922.1 hypothetical protein SYK_02820 [Pseudodesulfovibrio nedwellii]